MSRMSSIDARRPAPGQPAAAARRWPLTLPVAALVFLLAAAAGGAGAWYATGTIASGHQPPAATPRSPAPPGQLTAGGSPLVSLAPAAARYSGAGLIEPVITEYFQAINHRDYAGYLTTQSPGAAMSAQQFRAGFRSTVDSHVLVNSISTAPDGRPAADVTFTSRQQPQDGPGGESCTDWHMTMFLDDHGGTYTLSAPPASYHASYHACLLGALHDREELWGSQTVNSQVRRRLAPVQDHVVVVAAVLRLRPARPGCHVSLARPGTLIPPSGIRADAPPQTATMPH
jgi:hypothetical protein